MTQNMTDGVLPAWKKHPKQPDRQLVDLSASQKQFRPLKYNHSYPPPETKRGHFAPGDFIRQR